MSTQTTNYGLIKPDTADYYDISVFNQNADIIDNALKGKAEQTEVDELKKSVADGKTLVANAISGKGITTAKDAPFATMATNIGNIKVGIDTSGATATTGDIIAGKTAGVGGAIITGTMANNGAISQSLGINGSYTIPAGYHNGSGKVTQSIATKGAETFTPNDTTQTIAQGRYLTGAQTISPVPTETKTVTAGTSASTVNRTSGKYMTAVTVNPTPSQSKSVTLTSSPLTVYPDAGYLLSGVTVSANLGKKYATGSGFTTVAYGTYAEFSRNDSGGVLTTSTVSTQTMYGGAIVVTTGLSWTPSVIRFKVITSNVTFMGKFTDGNRHILFHRTDAPEFFYLAHFYDSVSGLLPLNNGNTYYLPIVTSVYGTVTEVTWEAWE